jgi:hypothetical protein
MWGWLVLTALVTSWPARADTSSARSTETSDAADADALIEQGVALREQGHDREALAVFQRAAGLRPSPRAEAQVALAQQALGQWVDAEAGLVRALAAPNDDWIERNRPALEQALATVRGQLGWITVDTDTPGAQVRIDGRPIPALPMPEPLRVPAGVVVVEALAPGYVSAVRYIEIHAGERAHQSMTLLPQAMPSALPAAAPSSPGSPESRSATIARRRTWAWISLGAAAALVGGGIAAHVVREVNAAKYDDPACVSHPEQTRDEVCGGYGSTARTATVLAVIGYSAGGAAAVLSAVLLFTGSPAPGSSPSRAAARCGFGAGPSGWAGACTVPF